MPTAVTSRSASRCGGPRSLFTRGAGIGGQPSRCARGPCSGSIFVGGGIPLAKSGSTLTLTERMASIKKVDTRPEMKVRKLIHAQGYRYRLHRRDLPGTPDLVFPRLRKIIFVHGCFWHRHSCRDGRKLPSGKQDYWIPKFERNVERDQADSEKLRALGWELLVIWECQLSDRQSLQDTILGFLGSPVCSPRPFNPRRNAHDAY
jgi:DNA mismatch endonuclease (patch repair protein)